MFYLAMHQLEMIHRQLKRNLAAIVEKLEGDTSTFKTYVEIYSDQPYSLDTAIIKLYCQKQLD